MLKHVEEDAIERANLVEKLALRTEEAAHHARNFQQMAELAPCGEPSALEQLGALLIMIRHVYV